MVPRQTLSENRKARKPKDSIATEDTESTENSLFSVLCATNDTNLRNLRKLIEQEVTKKTESKKKVGLIIFPN
ncbi:hypothetical protein Pla144_07150 [Bythopirellula polymerisocia]|uniref:Uncharacterized protein n=1 Tax=Bythopirellula polymerisocia TaxID=2528003 RepID=A0A5C6D258_9BACT|nr:hypothetical protein Pla144_07150 [Bythopirellula polymerisocia]